MTKKVENTLDFLGIIIVTETFIYLAPNNKWVAWAIAWTIPVFMFFAIRSRPQVRKFLKLDK